MSISTIQAYSPIPSLPPQAVLVVNVLGKPVSQGSKRVFWNKRTQRAFMTEAAGQAHKAWRSAITEAAIKARDLVGWDRRTETRGYAVGITFVVSRPKSHYRTGKNAGLVAESAPAWPTASPDLDKLTRAVLDGLTDAGVWVDDSQVVRLLTEKAYEDSTMGHLHDPGAYITIERW